MDGGDRSGRMRLVVGADDAKVVVDVANTDDEASDAVSEVV